MYRAYSCPSEKQSNGRRTLTKSFECRRGGAVCGAKITGDTDEEVLQKAVEHARKRHGIDLSQSRTLAKFARSLIREER